MKKDKLLQHQLARLSRMLALHLNVTHFGAVTDKGMRIIDMAHRAVCRSLARYRRSLNF